MTELEPIQSSIGPTSPQIAGEQLHNDTAEGNKLNAKRGRYEPPPQKVLDSCRF